MADLAKISRPKLIQIHPREGLFARLDDHFRRGAVWLTGPPGAGKTTAAASYLDARALPVLWYQIDRTDSDPASFFYFLKLAAEESTHLGHARLPLLTPEYMPDLVGFARRFFRALCAALPRPSVLVFDNYQELPLGAPLQAVLGEALAEIPTGIHALFVSRADPPAPFARWLATRSLHVVGWDALKLTDEDTARIVAQIAPRAQAPLPALIARCGGWVAGLILLLQQLGDIGDVSAGAQSLDALFHYFASEFFDRQSPEIQHVLLRTALLPFVSVEAARVLTSDDKAGAILAELRRRHLFTEARGGATPTYEYHALFREFLTARLRETVPASDVLRLAHRSAAIQARQGHIESAFQLYCVAEDYGAAAELIMRHAPELVSQGRLQTLATAIAALPASLVDRDPWLIFWQGVCQMAQAPLAARAVFERSFEGFKDAGDVMGQIQSASRILDTRHIIWAEWPADDPWIGELERLLEAEPVFSDSSSELYVHGSLIMATLYSKLGSAQLERSIARVKALVHQVPNVNARFVAAEALLTALDYAGALKDAVALDAQLQPFYDGPTLAVIHRSMWVARMAYVYGFAGEWDKAYELTDANISVIEREGLRFLLPIYLLAATQISLMAGDKEEARRRVARAAPLIDERPSIRSWYLGMLTGIAILDGDRGAVARHSEPMYGLMQGAGPGVALINAQLYRIYALCAMEQYDDALALAGDARLRTRALSPSGSHHDERVPEAYALLMLGRHDEAAAVLRESLSVWASREYVTADIWVPAIMSRLYAFALERGIETDYVTHLIRLRGLSPPAETSAWVWPVQIRTLGRFEIQLDGKPLETGRKAPRKLLTFLKALIALGGENVSEQRLADVLYPDHDGDTALELVATSLHRVRKLLGDATALVRSEGRISINSARVWLDVRTFERLEPGAGETALSLFRGSFLAEEEAAWAAAPRERLERRFIRLVIAEGTRRETEQDHGSAAALYARGVEAAPLAEEFYQGLIRCYKAEGREAEARAVYGQLEQILTSVSARPSAVTRTLLRIVNLLPLLFCLQELSALYLQWLDL